MDKWTEMQAQKVAGSILQKQSLVQGFVGKTRSAESDTLDTCDPFNCSELYIHIIKKSSVIIFSYILICAHMYQSVII